MKKILKGDTVVATVTNMDIGTCDVEIDKGDTFVVESSHGDVLVLIPVDDAVYEDGVVYAKTNHFRCV